MLQKEDGHSQAGNIQFASVAQKQLRKVGVLGVQECIPFPLLPPKDVCVLTPTTCSYVVYIVKGLCRCDQIKDLGLKRLFWII